MVALACLALEVTFTSFNFHATLMPLNLNSFSQVTITWVLCLWRSVFVCQLYLGTDMSQRQVLLSSLWQKASRFASQPLLWSTVTTTTASILTVSSTCLQAVTQDDCHLPTSWRSKANFNWTVPAKNSNYTACAAWCALDTHSLLLLVLLVLFIVFTWTWNKQHMTDCIIIMSYERHYSPLCWYS